MEEEIKSTEFSNIRLCGCNEECFKQGKCWGHLEGVMCEHLEEHDISPMVSTHVCGITKKIVAVYTNKREYDELVSVR